MKSLWKNNFKPLITDTPKDIIQYQCSSLNEITKGVIVARITEYAEPIFPYIRKGPINAVAGALGDKKVIAQDSLGEVPGGGFTFEFHISSIATPNYKYRILFLQYNTEVYPAMIVMDETIAQELQLEQYVSCANQEDFESVLEKILNSKKVGHVISALLGNAEKEQRASVQPQ